MPKIKTIIMGAAGRDFHDFNVYFRQNSDYEVVAFTATQIPDIAGRQYPPELSGELYPKGIPIYAESDLTKLIKENKVDQVLLSYSDLPHVYVMNKASQVLAAGADFRLLGPAHTMLSSSKPIVSICAVRTGCGKSQTSRKVVDYYKNKGLKVVAVRHPMPYGDLAKQAVQRFAAYEDLDKHECTIEEREEYEPYVEQGLVIYAGVDYEKILREAEKEADIIIWDGGNNDLPFYKPNLHIVVTDPHRAGHEVSYHPGEANFRMADVIVINKMDTADPEKVKIIEANAAELNPAATIIKANSSFEVEKPELIKGKRVLVVEDGPTLTHGEMAYGVGVVAAKKFGAKELIDPRPFAVGTIKETFDKFTQLENLVPAMGYGDKQMKELEDTINKSDAEAVVIGTPIDLGKLLKIDKPVTRVTYYLDEIDSPNLAEVLAKANLVK
ncbi:cyclic 2,3-diphosphoglycerate synthase [Patescibacteria group bacterium]|nr:cyclic 2,3-diphosphoglycerate synthase [Patescibacteria group bacterium]